MPEVFRHARRRSRFHARLRDEAERAQAAAPRRVREGGGSARRAAAADSDWRHEQRSNDDTSGGVSAAPHSRGAGPQPPL